MAPYLDLGLALYLGQGLESAGRNMGCWEAGGLLRSKPIGKQLRVKLLEGQIPQTAGRARGLQVDQADVKTSQFRAQ